jgi:broad specificity phosphatase PhoE
VGTLYLVRHGQASFGADDYDRLSELGRRQCVRLGEWFRAKGIVFEAALVGTLRRQVDSLQGIAEGARWQAEPLSWPGLNEYDSEALIRTVHAGPLAAPASADEVRRHFRLLRDGLGRWMDASAQPEGMPSYADFAAGVAGALDHVRSNHADHVLLVASGGPIATAVGQVLGMAPAATIELNLRLRNSAVTEFVFTPKRHALLSFNTLPHLDGPEHAPWVTYT